MLRNAHNLSSAATVTENSTTLNFKQMKRIALKDLGCAMELRIVRMDQMSSVVFVLMTNFDAPLIDRVEEIMVFHHFTALKRLK